MLTDRQPVTPQFVEICLEASGMEYTVEDYGAFRILFPQERILLYISICRTHELRFLCVFQPPIRPGKLTEALLVCNIFHKKTKYGRGFVSERGDNNFASYELWLDCEDGGMSEYLFRKVVSKIVLPHDSELLVTW
jgi:hypothetical protein